MITFYTKTGCPYCAAKREELTAKKIPFKEINITDHPEVIPELLKLTKGRRKVPVLVDGDKVTVAPEGG